MILPIRLYGDPVLRKKATPVTKFDAALKQLADDLLETMYHYNGVGLAGPQVGLGKRIFTALHTDKDDDEAEDAAQPKTVAEKRQRWGVVGEYVMINPVIVSNRGTELGTEGCLSLPGLYYEEVSRAEQVTVRYQDITGQQHELEAEGHFARVIQHEFDHLDGILFTERLPERERRDFMDEHRKALADMQREAKAFLKELKDKPQIFEVM